MLWGNLGDYRSRVTISVEDCLSQISQTSFLLSLHSDFFKLLKS